MRGGIEAGSLTRGMIADAATLHPFMPNADRISEVYKGEIWKSRTQLRARNRIDWLVSQARGEVLDVGCSQGIVSILCAREGMHVLGIDNEADRIAYANADRDAEPAEVRERLRFEVGDASDLDVPDDSYDTVIFGEVLEHLADPEPVLAEIARVTKPDGAIVMTTPFGYSPHHDHKATFFVASLLEVVSSQLTVDSLEIVESYFRILARPGGMTEEGKLRLLAELQPVLETNFLETQIEHRREKAAAARRKKRIKRLRRRLRRQRKRTAQSQRRLRALRRRGGRPRRVAATVAAAVRRPSRMRRLPADLRKAMRKPAAKRAATDGEDRDRSAGSPTGPAPAGPRVKIPEVELPEGPIARPNLTVATILDPFSALAFRYEWNQIAIDRRNWRAQLQDHKPDLLFVESAWRGNDGSWAVAMTGPAGTAPPLHDVVAWCRHLGIPTVFWNKEDPPNFERFIETAKMFDWIFTVDGDCIPRYREALGHDRIGLFQFGAQPRVHNPIEVEGGREYDVAFAGSNFAAKHPARAEQMESVLEPARDFGLHVFSRFSGDPEYDFPPSYAENVVGSLPYERMLAAYKRYKVFLNINSVTESPTMCARRVFELAACGTPVVSGHSRGVEATFGPLVPTAYTPDDTRQHLERLLGDAELRRKLAHRAMREVLSKHTYGHRVDEMLGRLGLAEAKPTPKVSVLLPTKRESQVAHAIEQVAHQSWRPLQLVIVLHDLSTDPGAVTEMAEAAGLDDVIVLEADGSRILGDCMNMALDAADGDLLAKMDDDNLYGEHYLEDLVHAFDYADAEFVGKWAHYVHLKASGATMLRFAYAEQRYVDLVQGGTILAKGDALRELRWDQVPMAVDTTMLNRAKAEGARVYSADRFSFVSVRHDRAHDHTWPVSDGKLMSSARSVSYEAPETIVAV